jgi:hypothetical protein
MGACQAVSDVLGLKGASLFMTLPANTSTRKATLRHRLRWLELGAVLAAVVGLLSVGLASSAVAADSCANATARVQTGSTELPDCRAFEMVSAPYKEGFPILPGGATVAFTENGIVSYQSRGAFAGNGLGTAANLYHATRSAVGWTTSSLEPSGTIYSTSLGESAVSVLAESADLRWSLWRMYRPNIESANSVGPWLRGPDGAFTRIGGSSFILGASDDLAHVVVDFAGLSEYVGINNDGPPRPVSINNDGQALPSACLPADVTPSGRVTVPGQIILFVSACSGSRQLWARAGGTATVAVSASECTREADDPGGLCNGVSSPTYAGRAADGSRVFFTTSQQLVNGDTDVDNGTDLFAGNDLYACDIPVGSPVPVGSANPCAPLTEVSGAATDAQVESVVSVSEDGSRVYFVARGVLADNLDVGGVGARAGAKNLYLWVRDSGHPAGQTRYVARLGSNDLTRAQMTPDGRYLVFVTGNKLEPGDTDNDARDVYRYDSVTHEIVRVSSSVAGGGGNTPELDALVPDKPAVSADGSTVIFDTVEALSPSDTNDVSDVYSWRDGQVSMISAGGGSALGVTPSGRDLFFMTAAQLSSADRDINTDIYDARLGGGFAPAPTPPSCFGDQCQDERSQVPSLAGPSPVGPGSGVPEVAPVFSVRAVSAVQRRALAATGKVSLTVTTNTPGTINARATTTIAGRSVAVGSGRGALTGAGRVAVALTLSKKARAQLALRGRLTVKVAVSHSKVALDRSVTLKLVHAKAKAKRSVKQVQRSVARVGGGRS